MGKIQIYAPTDPRLGRHVIHDDRSWDYRIARAPLPTKTVMHERHLPVWDQGNVGSCTANAALGMLATGPFWKPEYRFTEQDALKLYEEETALDDNEIPGRYPPDDTGSSGLYACKALKNRGLIASYAFLFTTNAVIAQVGVNPVIIGIPWFEGMFKPNIFGNCTPKGRIAGGHEIVLDGVDPKRERVRFTNSWGASWGKSGRAYLTYRSLDMLLKQNGDAVTVSYT